MGFNNYVKCPSFLDINNYVGYVYLPVLFPDNNLDAFGKIENFEYLSFKFYKLPFKSFFMKCLMSVLLLPISLLYGIVLGIGINGICFVLQFIYHSIKYFLFTIDECCACQPTNETLQNC
jgi:hypothetical protein